MIKEEISKGVKLNRLNQTLRVQQEAARERLQQKASVEEQEQARKLREQAAVVSALEEELADLKMHLKVLQINRELVLPILTF